MFRTGFRCEGGIFCVKDVSAQKAAPQEGARLPQAHVHEQRPQGACPPQGEGKSEAELLNSGGTGPVPRVFAAGVAFLFRIRNFLFRFGEP